MTYGNALATQIYKPIVAVPTIIMNNAFKLYPT